MSVIAPTTPFGYSVFCDDVRQEVTGKLIYIGVYMTDMILGHVATTEQANPTPQPFPFLLQSLVVVVRYLERRNESTEPVTIKIFLPGRDDPFVTAPIDVDGMRSVPAVDFGPNEDPLVAATIPFRFPAVLIEREGLIRVRAYRGDDEIRLGTLNVKVAIPQVDGHIAEPSQSKQTPSEEGRGKNHPDWGKF